MYGYTLLAITHEVVVRSVFIYSGLHSRYNSFPSWQSTPTSSAINIGILIKKFDSAPSQNYANRPTRTDDIYRNTVYTNSLTVNEVLKVPLPGSALEKNGEIHEARTSTN